MITVRFATTATIHALRDNGETFCGSEVHRNPGSGITSIRQFKQVEGEVSCKRCIKLMPAEAAAEAPAPASAWTCPSCNVERPTDPTGAELLRHMQICKGDIKSRALRMIEAAAELAETATDADQYAKATYKQLEAERLATANGAVYLEIVAARRAGYAAAQA